MLGLQKEAGRPGGYTPPSKGLVRIAVNLHSDLHEDHPVRPAARERAGRWKPLSNATEAEWRMAADTIHSHGGVE